MLFVLAASSCVPRPDTDDTDVAVDDTTAEDAAIAAALWAEIADHQTWGRPPTWSSDPVLSGNHGTYIIRYDNAVMMGWDQDSFAPAGAIALKEHYADAAGAELTGLVVMKKIPGYDADHSDWFWALFEPDGGVGMSGKVPMCLNCHSQFSQDSVYPLPPEGD